MGGHDDDLPPPPQDVMHGVRKETSMCSSGANIADADVSISAPLRKRRRRFPSTSRPKTSPAHGALLRCVAVLPYTLFAALVSSPCPLVLSVDCVTFHPKENGRSPSSPSRMGAGDFFTGVVLTSSCSARLARVGATSRPRRSTVRRT